jgi:DHA1 family solute carrier family 18 vesicular amine transporter 1/2
METPNYSSSGDKRDVPFRDLLRDPLIILTAGMTFFSTMGIAMVDPTLPIHMLRILKSKSWQLGIVFLPGTILFAIGPYIFGSLAAFVGRWLISLIGLLVIGTALILIPFCKTWIELMVVMGIMLLAMSSVTISATPLMGYLVDTRHDGHHGKVYSLWCLSFTLASVFGPVVGGPLTDTDVKFDVQFWCWEVLALFISCYCIDAALVLSSQMTRNP